MILLPPLTPAYGALAVSALTTRTRSALTPNASAAIAAKVVWTPVMSATPVMTVIFPSESSRQAAAAGSYPPGHHPIARPTPSSSGSEWRFAHMGWSPSRSRHSRAPNTLSSWPATVLSPGTSTLRRRSSSGSIPSRPASSSISDSTANAAGGAVGAR